MRNDFCVFIISYDRPKSVPTIDSLKRYGYTGDWRLVVDHEADVQPYSNEYGEDKVIYLDKDGALPELDRGDNQNRRDCNVYARQQMWDLAGELGYDYFLVLDDDYTNIQYRFNGAFDYDPEVMRDFDDYIDACIEFLDQAGLDTLCMAQGGDFIGGSEASFASSVMTKRKAMNSFLCKTDRPFNFRGTINEDVNTYVRAAQYGKLFLTTNTASIEQETTQQEDGGLTNIYLDQGTYMKSFYTILYAPSCTSLMNLHDRADPRIHHNVSWRNAVPKIIPEEYKKEQTN